MDSSWSKTVEIFILTIFNKIYGQDKEKNCSVNQVQEVNNSSQCDLPTCMPILFIWLPVTSQLSLIFSPIYHTPRYIIQWVRRNNSNKNFLTSLCAYSDYNVHLYNSTFSTCGLYFVPHILWFPTKVPLHIPNNLSFVILNHNNKITTTRKKGTSPSQQKYQGI